MNNFQILSQGLLIGRLLRALSAGLHLLLVLPVLLVSGQALAAFTTYPVLAGVIYQTSGRERPPTIGDWYTTDPQPLGSGTTSSDRIHRVLLEFTPSQILACGGTCRIIVTDAESNGTGGGDEVFNAGDPTQYSLRDRSGTSTLQGPVTLPSGTADGTSITFTVSAAGTYQLTALDGAFPISGDATVGLNDDDNGWGLQVEGSGTTSDGAVALLQVTFQQNTAGNITYPLYFIVGPTTTDSTLALRNFDLDGGASSLTYTAPNGAVSTGTVSGNGVWNNGGTLNVGEDDVVADNAPAALATQTGVWTYTINNWTPTNQAIFVVNGAGVGLPLTGLAPTRAGNFSLSETTPASVCASPGQSVDYQFTVTNNYFTNDLLNLTLSAVPSGWTAVLLTAGGAALGNNDNINGLTYSGISYAADTGLIAPGASVNFILRVTPSATALGPFLAQINGLSYMDNRVDSANNTVYSASQTTYVCPSIAKAFSPATVAANANATLTFTIRNPNNVALGNLAFTDAYPSQLVNSTPLAVAGTCAGVTHSATAGGTSFNVTAGAVPAAASTSAASCTITTVVRSATAGTYDNTSSGVSGKFGGVSIGPGPVSNTAQLVVTSPQLNFLKTSVAFSDPVNGGSNAKRVPGGLVAYTLSLSNSGNGAVDADSVVIVDPIPANTALFVGDLGAPGSGPVNFVQASTPSGLSYSFSSLASASDDLAFSNDGGVSFGYVPVPASDGTDAAVTHLRINPKGVMAAASGGSNPGFSAQLRVRIK